MSAHPFVFAATVALCVACGDQPTGPSTLVGSYSLRDINGEAPPRRIVATRTDTTWLLSEMITLGADGRATIEAKVRESTGGARAERSLEQSGGWGLVNGTITITSSRSAVSPTGVILGWDGGRTWSPVTEDQAQTVVMRFDRYVYVWSVR